MITPDDAAKITDAERASLIEIEKAVDKLLRERYQGSRSVRVTAGLEKMTERARTELLRRYTDAGWKIEKKHEAGDQRDLSPGYDYWLFTAQREPKLGWYSEQAEYDRSVTEWSERRRG